MNEVEQLRAELARVADIARRASDYYAKVAAYGYKNSNGVDEPEEFYQFEDDLWEAARTLDLLIPENQ